MGLAFHLPVLNSRFSIPGFPFLFLFGSGSAGLGWGPSDAANFRHAARGTVNESFWRSSAPAHRDRASHPGDRARPAARHHRRPERLLPRLAGAHRLADELGVTIEDSGRCRSDCTT